MLKRKSDHAFNACCDQRAQKSWFDNIFLKKIF